LSPRRPNRSKLPTCAALGLGRQLWLVATAAIRAEVVAEYEGLAKSV